MTKKFIIDVLMSRINHLEKGGLSPRGEEILLQSKEALKSILNAKEVSLDILEIK